MSSNVAYVYHANACGATTLFGHANSAGAAIFLRAIVTKIFNKKD
jgi:hypothetical protein